MAQPAPAAWPRSQLADYRARARWKVGILLRRTSMRPIALEAANFGRLDFAHSH